MRLSPFSGQFLPQAKVNNGSQIENWGNSWEGSCYKAGLETFQTYLDVLTSNYMVAIMATQFLGHDLKLGLDLSVSSSTLSAASENSPHVLVLWWRSNRAHDCMAADGQGGIVSRSSQTTGRTFVRKVKEGMLSLLNKLPSCSLIENISLPLTLQIAGAPWEYPPAVCGSHIDELSLEYSKGWAMTPYRVWSAIASLPHHYEASTAGVRIRKSTFFFPEPLKYDQEHEDGQFEKMMQIQHCGVSGFRHDPYLIEERGISFGYGAMDAYEIDAPVIDTDVATAWLMSLVKQKGARLITETIYGDQLAQEDSLCRRFRADVIVNATGLAARDFASDKEVYPLRGALIRDSQ